MNEENENAATSEEENLNPDLCYNHKKPVYSAGDGCHWACSDSVRDWVAEADA